MVTEKTKFVFWCVTPWSCVDVYLCFGVTWLIVCSEGVGSRCRRRVGACQYRTARKQTPPPELQNCFNMICTRLLQMPADVVLCASYSLPINFVVPFIIIHYTNRILLILTCMVTSKSRRLVLRQVHRLFQSDFASKYGLLLPISSSIIFYLP